MDLTEAEDFNKRWQEYRETIQNSSSRPRYPQGCDHSPGARHPRVQCQVGLRKHHYEQS